MSEETEKFIYFINRPSEVYSEKSEHNPIQVTKEEWEASWLSWWNGVEKRRREQQASIED